MSGDPLEGAVPAAAEGAAAPQPGLEAKPVQADGEAPRPRTVPRPGGPVSVRKPTLPGAAEPPQTPPPGAAAMPMVVPPPTGNGGEPLPKPPMLGGVDDEAVLTERRPSVPVEEPPTSGDGDGPPPMQRFLSPPPPAPRSESPSSGGEGSATRRRSRRTVKIPDDAVPHRVTPPPPEVISAPPPPIAAIPPERPPPPIAAMPPERPHDRPALPVIPPSPPVPTLSPRSGVPRPAPVPRPTEETARAAADEVPAWPDEAAEAFEVIRPMRIISIGSQPPPAGPPAVLGLSAAGPDVAAGSSVIDDSGWEEAGPRRISRPPMLASPELDAFVASPTTVPQPPTLPQPPATPPPSRAKPPPVVEEVEAIADDDADASVAAPTLRTEEIESIPDDEIVAERISTHETDDIPVDVVEPPAPKKPPPPPPKRSADAAPASSPVPSVSPAPSAPSATSGARPAEPALGPPPPAAAPSGPPLTQTLDLSGRKRQKPWWEEIFSDDYLRTMEKTESRIIRKECDFIEDRLGLEKGAVMLDLACGAGAHAVELSGRGYNVVGYDLSLAMLAQAQDEALERGQKLNFLHGDMREMQFEGHFDGIYSWNTSFGYFDDEKNLNVLSRIHRGLRQGGLFLLDIANRDYICPRQPSLVWFEGDGCVCMDEMHVDFFSSRLRVKRTVMFEDGRARECEYGIRLYGLHELGKMLHETGFKVVEITGHPAHPGVFFGSESPRIIVLAERS